MEFKSFLVNEQKDYFASKIGNVLTSVQQVISSGKQIGTRQLIRDAEQIVNQIRRVLHSSWSSVEKKYLPSLQKCGVGIMKAIDEKGDLIGVLNSCRSEIEKVLNDIGEPINQLGDTSKEKAQEDESDE